jgi:uncharacterized membrane protein
MMNGHAAQDAKLEQIIRTILKIGVATSSAFLAVGLGWSLLAPGSAIAATLLTIGLLILMATPISRVAASVVEYTVERDWLFVLLTSIVLLEIVAGVIAALVFHRRL